MQDTYEIITRNVITEKVPKRFTVLALGMPDCEVLAELKVYSSESMSGCAMCCPWNGHAYRVWSNEFLDSAIHGNVKQGDKLFFYHAD